MGRIFGCLLLILMGFGAFLFVRGWNGSTPWGASTGTIGSDTRGGDNRGPAAKTRSTLIQIAENPTRFEGKRMSVTGRVRGATKIASNRNLYVLHEDDYRVLVIDDKAAPADYSRRTVTGEVRVIGPKIGSFNYAYIVDAKPGVRIDPPEWNEVARFFTEKYRDVSSEVKDVGKSVGSKVNNALSNR